jgi:hypothetical protein
MSQFIDRRAQGGKKNTVNRQRFLQRYKNQIKHAVSNAIDKRGIREIERGEPIVIAPDDMDEPHFCHGKGGCVEHVLPGNDQFQAGDRIPRTPPAADATDAGNNQGSEQQDHFMFELSRDEFLDAYFDELELPDLIKKQFAQINTVKTIRSGVTTSGIPTNMNILRSMRQAIGRRTALCSGYKRKLSQAKKKLKALSAADPIDTTQCDELKQQIIELKKKITTIPFLDTIDLRYNNRVRTTAPSTQAVMICIMDVSGSMDDKKKEMAKRFFILLYLFLTKNYQKIELIFIRHHTSAKEVTEQDFFYSRETGGTVVSSALELLHHIITTRYPSQTWNIYVAQASDGDNWNADSPFCLELLRDKIMPLLQYFAYIEIMPKHHQSLWEMYQQLTSLYPQFAMKNIDTLADIFPVFRALFQRKLS